GHAGDLAAAGAGRRGRARAAGVRAPTAGRAGRCPGRPAARRRVRDPAEGTPPVSTAPLSFAQRGIWFRQMLSPGSAEYNMPVALRLRGPLDRAALARALREVVARHEVLRSTCRMEGDEPVAVVSERVRLP